MNTVFLCRTSYQGLQNPLPEHVPRGFLVAFESVGDDVRLHQDLSQFPEVFPGFSAVRAGALQLLLDCLVFRYYFTGR